MHYVNNMNMTSENIPQQVVENIPSTVEENTPLVENTPSQRINNENCSIF